MARGGRLIYAGAGTAGRLGVLDASECPPTFNTDPSEVIGLIAGGPTAMVTAVEGAEDSKELAAADLDALGLTADDTVVGISASGRTPYAVGAVEHARAQGRADHRPVLQRGLARSAAAAEHGIEIVVGPELLTGSTRLKAGTAQKLVLNMLSTITMIRLGKTYGNLMVDVRASNEKLRARSRRIVALATGASDEEIEAALAATDGEVKNAILTILGRVDGPTAAPSWPQSDGHCAPPSRPHHAPPDPDPIRGTAPAPPHSKAPRTMATEDKNRATAAAILPLVGGAANVSSVVHCMTRLRLGLHDRSLVDDEALKALPAVMGVVEDDTYQIVLGPGTVARVTPEFEKLVEEGRAATPEPAAAAEPAAAPTPPRPNSPRRAPRSRRPGRRRTPPRSSSSSARSRTSSSR